MVSCINLQISIVIFKISILLKMHHHERYTYINFQQNRVNSSVIIVHTNVFPKKITNFINLQLPIVIFKKSILSGMYHRKTYTYMNFQQKAG